ncbi:carboxypeptidase C [Lachancea thermotolerans CBS 6340]|uniref:Carboxypeptidase n=1 Tax=Lachancea thermotolerans (strain ATCC 56472 / CBS 6340 / NRRL Y-8284) TaxID=559295 RepID=C5DNC9_LACTC|nr:KLTH0G15950p [Lachancea thermotolerans CBS 6340]CAR25290.1 KLTH0G15950p [Lachancea thermotolerans CBS 6340]
MKLSSAAYSLLGLSSIASAFSLLEGLGLESDLAHLWKGLRVPKNTVQSIKNVRESLDEFVTIKSELDDTYSMRVKRVDPSKLGVDSVKQYSGYLDYEDSKHFFYWAFESRNDPLNDPVILWLNGGPGCSSFTGLFFELGPSSVGPELKPVRNPYSWNNNATVIFLEQPLGVGFSYGDERVASTNAAGKDVFIFLELFFQEFPQFRSNDFHIAGESYAGHYIPEIAHQIAVVHESDKTFNLTSIMIGNGITDSLVQYDYYEPMACGRGGYKAVITEEECAKMRNQMPRCRALNNACYSSSSTFACIAAGAYCENMAMSAYTKTGLNVYDIRSPCETEEGGLCYAGLSYVEDYLNQPEVQVALGSDVSNFTGCSNEVGLAFLLTGDNNRPFQQYVAELVNRDIPVLLYAGDKDFICNWLGNLAWSDELEWKHKEQYSVLPLRPWKSEDSGETLGQVKSYSSFTFLRVFGAGHMVPYNQPEASLEMVNRWISGDYSLGY